MKKRKEITPEQIGLGERIKKARKELNLSREYMAEMLGVSLDTPGKSFAKELGL